MATNNPAISQVLDRVTLVIFQTRIVSPIRDTGEGERDGSRIKKVLQSCFDPIVLRPLARKKQEASRLCRSFGTSVASLGAWAVPIERTKLLTERLAKISDEWAELAEELAINIATKVEAYAQENPAEAAAIRSLAPSASDVRSSTRFIYTSYRLRAEDVDDDSGCLESDMIGLAGQTLREFAVALCDASLNKGTGLQYTQSVKEVLRRVETKARSLAFLNPVLDEVSKVLTETISALPVSGAITNASAILVKTIVDQLLDPAKLLKNGFAKFEQSDIEQEQVDPVVNQPAEVTDVVVMTPKVPPADQSIVQSVPNAAPAAAIPQMAFCV